MSTSNVTDSSNLDSAKRQKPRIHSIIKFKNKKSSRSSSQIKQLPPVQDGNEAESSPNLLQDLAEIKYVLEDATEDFKQTTLIEIKKPESVMVKEGQVISVHRIDTIREDFDLNWIHKLKYEIGEFYGDVNELAIKQQSSKDTLMKESQSQIKMGISRSQEESSTANDLIASVKEFNKFKPDMEVVDEEEPNAALLQSLFVH